MHIFFSGIGGTAIGPLALITKQAGHQVSGSDKQRSRYTDYLISKGIEDIAIDSSEKPLKEAHSKVPVDWFVYSSAVAIEQPDSPEFEFCRQNNIKMTKRDELLNHIIIEKDLKLIAVAGTHGKTTTTAMAIWLFKKLGIPASWSVGAKISFGEMGQFNNDSEYFILETDEFDRNFLAFKPYLSLITGVTWDHHEIFPTKQEYWDAFLQFIEQSNQAFIWQSDAERIGQTSSGAVTVLRGDGNKPSINNIAGFYNRLDAWLVASAISSLVSKPVEELGLLLNDFPGLQRRMEQIVPNLYSDYAHTPEKIKGALSTALEIAKKNQQRLVVVYEPLTNRRQHYMKNDYQNCFKGAEHVYWVPSYLAREDPNQSVLQPKDLINYLTDPSIATPSKIDEELKQTINQHLNKGDMVVAIAGGGGDSLDEWIRQEFTPA